jgi:hypothetical protein
MPPLPKSETRVIPAGTSLKLRCDEGECFVGEVLVTSKGGAVHPSAPVCPNCARHLTPLSETLAPPLQPFEE